MRREKKGHTKDTKNPLFGGWRPEPSRNKNIHPGTDMRPGPVLRSPALQVQV